MGRLEVPKGSYEAVLGSVVRAPRRALLRDR